MTSSTFINEANDRSDPIGRLKREHPDLFAAPAFWRSTLEDTAGMAEALKAGRAEVIGRSAGGREHQRLDQQRPDDQPA